MAIKILIALPIKTTITNALRKSSVRDGLLRLLLLPISAYCIGKKSAGLERTNFLETKYPSPMGWGIRSG